MEKVSTYDKPKMILTYQTEDHDFYCEDPNIMNVHPFYSHIPWARIYNIIPKGAPTPESGYYKPQYIMKVKGYKHLTVRECFIEHFKT